MTRRSISLGLTLLLAACSGTPWRSVTEGIQARQFLGQADGLAQNGDHAAARDLYQQVIREHPASPWAARALFRLARLLVTPDSPVRDYRQAYRYFDRLLVEYPESPQVGEARAWREALAQLLAREQEATRIQQDLERLKKIDKELERRRP